MTTLSNQLFDIEQLTRAIITQIDDPLYTILDLGYGQQQLITSPLMECISTAIRAMPPILQTPFTIYEFNPFVRLFVYHAVVCDLVENVQMFDTVRKSNDIYQQGFDFERVLERASKMLAFVNQIRQDARTPGFRAIIDDAERCSGKNLEGILAYIDSLFEHYARLLVVRLDLGYQKGHVITNNEDILRKYDQAKHDFQHFLKNLKRHKLFEHKVGHIWKLEYGPDKGFHYHLYLFFDGSKVKDDVLKAFQVGDYWVYSIARGLGVSWNCNLHKDQYPQCGIGMINHNDFEKINYLKQAVSYLVKIDHYVRMMTPEDSINFGRGQILPPRTDGPGRPRLIADIV